MPLHLTRQPGQRFLLEFGGVRAWIRFEGPDPRFRGEARFTIDAPREVAVHREELLDGRHGHEPRPADAGP